MKLIGALILCVQIVIVAQAQNWPSFRGTNATGVTEGRTTPTTWTIDKGQNVVWKTAIPGFSHASPIVWDNRVFVITAISSDTNANFIAKDRGIDLANDDVKHTWRIYCLDKKSGQIIWSQTAYEACPEQKDM